MLATSNTLKRWTIFNIFTNNIRYMTDQEFSEGIQRNIIELRGKYITGNNKTKIWIDGVIKK